MRTKFQPSTYSSYGLLPYGAEEDVAPPSEEPKEETPPAGDHPDGTTYEKYAGFARKLLGWDRSKAMEVAVLETRLYALEHGDFAAQIQAQAESGQISRQQAILRTRELLEVAQSEARQETFRNIGYTVLVVGGGVALMSTVALIGLKVVNQVQQARLTQAQIKQIQGK